MISLNKRKLLRRLDSKKHRDADSLFVAEGRKTVGDLLRGGMRCLYVAGIAERLAELSPFTSAAETAECEVGEITEVSALQTRSEVIAILRRPQPTDIKLRPDEVILALDGVQDPGNLGSILRTADWFGVRNIVCSNHCADAYGPKAVQATMGALCRLNIVYDDLQKWLSANTAGVSLPVYGTYLEGDNIYGSELRQGGIVLMGNEGHGISDVLVPFVTNKLFIPNYPMGTPTSESLNVGAATAVVLSEFRRRIGYSV